jgi:hypothetical protein
MSTTHYRKKLISSALGAAAVPALLFLGTGTAHAANVSVVATANPLGVTMEVRNGGGTDLGLCTYTATPTSGPLSGLLPYASLPFRLDTHGRFSWFIPGVPTGTDWTPAVSCNGVLQTVTSLTPIKY